MTPAEHQRVVAATVAAAAGRVPVIAGAGSNNTQTAVELAQSAEQAGAQALLCVTPYYLKPTQAGLIQHFQAIHDAVGIPVILYDVPSRTACPISDVTIKRLAELPRIVGLKDATGDIARVGRLRRRLGDRSCCCRRRRPSAFRLAGGDGCISVTANVAPAPPPRLTPFLRALETSMPFLYRARARGMDFKRCATVADSPLIGGPTVVVRSFILQALFRAMLISAAFVFVFSAAGARAQLTSGTAAGQQTARQARATDRSPWSRSACLQPFVDTIARLMRPRSTGAGCGDKSGTCDPYVDYKCLDTYLGDNVLARLFRYYQLE